MRPARVVLMLPVVLLGSGTLAMMLPSWAVLPVALTVLTFLAPYLIGWCVRPGQLDAAQARLHDAHAQLGIAHPATLRLVQSEARSAVSMGFLRSRTIFVTHGLVQALDDMQLRAVLAHEYGHLAQWHPLRAAWLSAAMMGTVVWLFPHQALPMVAAILVMLADRRSCELAADRYAAALIGAQSYIDVLAVLAKRLAQRDIPVWAQILSTHPSFPRRRAEIALFAAQTASDQHPNA